MQATGTPVLFVQEAGRADGFQVPMREHVLLVASILGQTQLHVRLQDGGTRRDSEGEPRGESRQGGQDLMGGGRERRTMVVNLLGRAVERVGRGSIPVGVMEMEQVQGVGE